MHGNLFRLELISGMVTRVNTGDTALVRARQTRLKLDDADTAPALAQTKVLAEGNRLAQEIVQADPQSPPRASDHGRAAEECR